MLLDALCAAFINHQALNKEFKRKNTTVCFGSRDKSGLTITDLAVNE